MTSQSRRLRISGCSRHISEFSPACHLHITGSRRIGGWSGNKCRSTQVGEPRPSHLQRPQSPEKDTAGVGQSLSRVSMCNSWLTMLAVLSCFVDQIIFRVTPSRASAIRPQCAHMHAFLSTCALIHIPSEQRKLCVQTPNIKSTFSSMLPALQASLR